MMLDVRQAGCSTLLQQFDRHKLSTAANAGGERLEQMHNELPSDGSVLQSCLVEQFARCFASRSRLRIAADGPAGVHPVIRRQFMFRG